jgi:hypothetical protein
MYEYWYAFTTGTLDVDQQQQERPNKTSLTCDCVVRVYTTHQDNSPVHQRKPELDTSTKLSARQLKTVR